MTDNISMTISTKDADGNVHSVKTDTKTLNRITNELKKPNSPMSKHLKQTAKELHDKAAGITPTPPLLSADQATNEQDRKTAAFTGARLKQYIERIERLQEEQKGLASDIRDVFAEAKSGGFDTKTMKALIRIRKLPPQERDEQDELLQLYMNAIGML